MVITSCDKTNTMDSDNDGKVRFTSGVTATPVSRVAIDADGKSVWNAGDPVGIFMVQHAATNVVDDATNMKYTASGAGISTTFTPSGADIYYPLDETAAVDFIAYHPYSEAASDFTYPIDLSTQTSQTAIDLMTAKADKGGEGYTKADGRTGTAVNFAFTHRLAKLVMNVTKDASVRGTITSVSITGMNTRATFDLKGDGGISSVSTLAAITPCTVTAEQKYEAILLPIGSLGDTHTVTFITDDNETYVWKMSNEISKLETGKIYTYTVNVTKYEVTANGSIKSWTLGSTGTGTAE